MFIDKMALAEFFQKEIGLYPITLEDLEEKKIIKKVKNQLLASNLF